MDYWNLAFLFDISKGVGTPLQIDKKTLNKELGLYARVLVDVNLAKELPEQIYFRKRTLSSFFIEYKRCPRFCKSCGVARHDFSQYRSQRGSDMHQEVRNNRRREKTYQRLMHYH